MPLNQQLELFLYGVATGILLWSVLTECANRWQARNHESRYRTGDETV